MPPESSETTCPVVVSTRAGIVGGGVYPGVVA